MGWMQIGWQVYELLDTYGFPEARAADSAAACAIECYPYATYVALSERLRPPGVEPAAWARRIIGGQGYRLVGTGKDPADAVAAALTTRAYAAGQAGGLRRPG